MNDYLLDAVKLGIFGAVHLGIYLNRSLIKPHITSQKLNNVITNLEHIVSYATVPMAFEVVTKYLGFTPEISLIGAVEINVIRAIGGDMIIPIVRSRRGRLGYNGSQWGQLVSDGVGTLAYLTLIHQ